MEDNLNIDNGKDEVENVKNYSKSIQEILDKKSMLLNEMEQAYHAAGDKTTFLNQNSMLISLLQDDKNNLTEVQQKILSDLETIRNADEVNASTFLEKEDNEMKKAIESIKRIIVKCDSVTRGMKPCQTHVDLVKKIETMFNASVLSIVSSTGLTIGSSHELQFAYEDAIDSTLIVDITLTKKRARDDSDDETSFDHPNEERNKGRWLNWEKVKLKEAIEQYGEKDYARISNYVKTRDRQQVRDFISSPACKRFKITPLSTSIVEGLNAAIKGMTSAVDGLKNHNENDKNGL